MEAAPVLYCPNHPSEREDGWSHQRILLADYSHKPSVLDYLPALR